jgi:hypothetical protein
MNNVLCIETSESLARNVLRQLTVESFNELLQFADDYGKGMLVTLNDGEQITLVVTRPVNAALQSLDTTGFFAGLGDDMLEDVPGVHDNDNGAEDRYLDASWEDRYDTGEHFYGE